MQEWVVSKDEGGSKLVAFLKLKLDQFSSKQLKSLIESNACTINGITERFASVVVHPGDRIVLANFIIKSITDRSLLNERILYQDEDILAYDKPPGIASEEFETKLRLIHRLDRETSGVLLFAKSKSAFDAMVELFRCHQVKKTYYAIVDGIPKQKKGRIDNFLGKKHAYQGQTIWGSVREGMRAITDWEVEQIGNHVSLIKCFPKTGRTHQLRVHLSEMGHPILGDFQYCKSFSSPFRPDRLLLHAHSISFPHLKQQRILIITSPLPDDFLKAKKELSL